MTNTRAASATFSLRAKQELVRLLFGSQLGRRGPQAHRLLDHSIYSYQDLRSAYLKRIHELHPDKKRANKDVHMQHKQQNSDATNTPDDDTSRFVELQEAWIRYEEIAKTMKRVGKGADTKGEASRLKIDADFTMFGVGCSFADNEQEKELRSKIMDEAGRGWFSAGQLSETTGVHGNTGAEGTRQRPATSLTSDDMFCDAESDRTKDESTSNKSQPKTRSSLISHLIPPHRR